MPGAADVVVVPAHTGVVDLADNAGGGASLWADRPEQRLPNYFSRRSLFADGVYRTTTPNTIFFE